MGQSKTKKTSAKAASRATAAKRQIKAPKRRLWKRQDKRFRQRPKIPSAFKITKTVAKLLWHNKKLFIGIALIYGILNVVLVRGLSGGTDVNSIKDSLGQIFGSHGGQVATSFGVFVVLLGSSGNGTSSSAGSYQLVLLIIVSLVVIWTLRQRLTGAAVRIRDGFYRGMYPLIPFVLVMIVIGLELIPLAIGAGLYSMVIGGGIAVHADEKILFAVISILLAVLSVYWLCSSIFALYIVTLPNMTPMKALRSARDLVRYRRWSIIRKLLFLPLILLVVAAAIVMPVIIFAAPAAQWVVFVLSMIAIIVIHTYLYTLYRELL